MAERLSTLYRYLVICVTYPYAPQVRIHWYTRDLRSVVFQKRPVLVTAD